MPSLSAAKSDLIDAYSAALDAEAEYLNAVEPVFGANRGYLLMASNERWTLRFERLAQAHVDATKRWHGANCDYVAARRAILAEEMAS